MASTPYKPDLLDIRFSLTVDLYGLEAVLLFKRNSKVIVFYG